MVNLFLRVKSTGVQLLTQCDDTDDIEVAKKRILQSGYSDISKFEIISAEVTQVRISPWWIFDGCSTM